MGLEGDIGKMLEKIYSGNAILFVGAGFSLGAENFDEEMPTAKRLSKIIAEIAGLPNDGEHELKDIADYFIEEVCKEDPQKLKEFISKMKDLFTARKATQSQVDIMSAPWKRIYTTNYDNLVELAASENKIRIEAKNIHDAIDYQTKVCLHINGRIEELNENTLNSTFKLTNSSYLSPVSFADSKWKRVFNDDIRMCPALVFVGYSLYDIEIEKILYDTQGIKDKVYFIQSNTGEKDNIKDFKYRKYGKLLHIGTETFAQLLKENKPIASASIKQASDKCLEHLVKFENNGAEDITEKEIEEFLLLGKLKEEHCVRGYLEDKRPPFLIKRKLVGEVVENLRSENIMCVNADIGNGKTIFLRELVIKLIQEGYHVYHNFYDNNNAEMYSVGYKQDIEVISKLNQSSAVVLDSCCRYGEILEFIKAYTKIKFVIADRTIRWANYVRGFDKTPNVKTIFIDTLDDEEIEQLESIISNLGWWNNKLKGASQKQNHIKEHCRAEISQSLIDIIKSQQIIDRYKNLLQSPLQDDKHSLYLFALCILNVMDIPISIAILEDIVGNCDFNVLNNEEFQNIFNVNLLGHDISMKSPIFSSMVLTTIFDWKTIIRYSLEILQKLHERKRSSNTTQILNEVRVNLYRFRFMERILPDIEKKVALQQYYERVKNTIPNIGKDPQYWLQYAMCYIMMKDYDKAQRMLNTAYLQAERDYDTYRIDNQQARLYLKVATMHQTNIKDALEKFGEADKLLLKRWQDDTYTYNVLLDYKEFVDSRWNNFNPKNKAFVKNICQNWLKRIESLEKMNRYGHEKRILQCKGHLTDILNMIHKSPES